MLGGVGTSAGWRWQGGGTDVRPYGDSVWEGCNDSFALRYTGCPEMNIIIMIIWEPTDVDIRIKAHWFKSDQFFVFYVQLNLYILSLVGVRQSLRQCKLSGQGLLILNKASKVR